MNKALITILLCATFITDGIQTAQKSEIIEQPKTEQAPQPKSFWKKFTPKQLALMAAGAATTALASFALFNTYLKNQKYKKEALVAGEIFKNAPMEVRLTILLGEATSFQSIKEQVAKFAAIGPEYAKFVKKDAQRNYTGPAKTVIDHKMNNIRHQLRKLSQECQKIDPACIIQNDNVDTRIQPNGVTPLMIAAQAGNKKIMAELLEVGADINALGQPLRYALYGYDRAKNNWHRNYYIEAIKFMLEHGAKVTERDLSDYQDSKVEPLLKKYKK